jgi:molecular chaperone DnaK (HSP70)
VSPTPTDTSSRRFVGIDLGTTNSALAWTDGRGAVRIFEVPQISAPGEISRFPTLPSFLYFPTDAERQTGLARLPWNESPEAVAGAFARDQGMLVPGRQIASAKSWLVNASVDRTAALLPWGTEEGPRLSPVDASARLLAHLRDAWNHEATTGSASAGLRLEEQSIVLTVPASFDDEARELTAQAARSAGMDRAVLIEEPIAALYAWIAGHRRHVAAQLPDDALVLVCDVGGGTTDFSLMRASTEGTDLRFERIAIGEHLLLGGDNLDLALAALVEQKLIENGAPRLALTQRLALRRKCSAAKERLLSDEGPEEVTITILGSGRGVVAGGVSAALTREEAVRALLDGFLPITRQDELPARDRRPGLRELGLPYETEPAITKHLAGFLTRAADERWQGAARPDAVLFNGGFFTPALARTRVVDVLHAWSGVRPTVLENERPEAAVAIGAAFYSRLREDPDAARRLLIRAGSARAYYIGLQTSGTPDGPTAVCVMPRATQEGTTLLLEHPFTVTTNQPVAFTLYSSPYRQDPLNTIVVFSDEEELHRHSPLVTVMRYGKRSRRVPLGVRLRVVFTETGALELWCESRSTDHRWRLSFNLRAAEADPLDVEADSGSDDGVVSQDQAVIGTEAVAHAVRLIGDVFTARAGSPGTTPEALVGDLESALGFGKHAWPLGVIRQLADALLAAREGRIRTPAHEVRWLNLTGFCTRPGFGNATDGWRLGELRQVYAAGLAFPKDVQCQVEWLVLWQRVAAGFTSGHQRELAQRIAAQLGIGQKKPPRLNPQIEREAWRLIASLERLDAGQRVKLGDELLPQLRRDLRNRSWLWALARLGARVPLYGPLNATVPPAVAARWIDVLIARSVSAEIAEAVVQIGARTGDPARDIGDDVRARVTATLASGGIGGDALLPLMEVVPVRRADLAQAFGESLPQGLMLADSERS